MSKHHSLDFADYVPVELRQRHDGWLPARQVDFLIALSQSACVEEACRAVGKSPGSAYALRRRIEAHSFRTAWDAALDFGVAQLGHAALSRALHGVARPVFYKGEQIGERRYYDERLTMFLLRMRDPVGHGAWRDRTRFDCGDDALANRADTLVEKTERDATGFARLTGVSCHLDRAGEDGASDATSRTVPDSGDDVA